MNYIPRGIKAAEKERWQLNSIVAMVKNAWSYAASPSQYPWGKA
jgi:hypothetical protein